MRMLYALPSKKGPKVGESPEIAASRILIVDDDAALSEMLQIVLQQEGYEPIWCSTGSAAIKAFRESRPDLVLLDLMLPGRDGVSICRDIRAESGVPIIMLTARSDTTDVVVGLEAGADDYVPKPFKPKELLARIRTRLRRKDGDSAPGGYRIGDIVISIDGHTVRVLSRESLLQAVWGYHRTADTRLVNVHIQRLRAKIERDPEHPKIVLTVRGVGYKAAEPSES